jgi:hypothetical protein
MVQRAYLRERKVVDSLPLLLVGPKPWTNRISRHTPGISERVSLHTGHVIEYHFMRAMQFDLHFSIKKTRHMQANIWSYYPVSMTLAENYLLHCEGD